MKTKSKINFAALLLLTCTSAFADAHVQELVLHDFGGLDSNSPSTGLASDAKGNLYGVTGSGIYFDPNAGSAFELSPTSGGWNFSYLHQFTGGFDGAFPDAPLIVDAEGDLYGTTLMGGGTCNFQQTGGCGTVFKLSPNSTGGWTETVLHRFSSTTDGAYPGSLTRGPDGNLYGVTEFAGSVSPTCPEGCGTIYELTPDGETFTVLHTFAKSDGAFPENVVFDAAGDLYGTADGGGVVNNVCGGDGCGLLFKMTPSGRDWIESIVYTFAGGTDGMFPGSLTFGSSGNLYGVTFGGGSGDPQDCGFDGCGTAFTLTPKGNSWNYRVIHAFSFSDGATPAGITIVPNPGTLYGTTSNDGPDGFGTVYKLVEGANGQWRETILYSFTGNADGGFPQGAVIVGPGGDLYGTAYHGGTLGQGVVFEIVDP